MLGEMGAVVARFMQLRAWEMPVARVLAGLEILLAKMEDWESLASKRINSLG